MFENNAIFSKKRDLHEKTRSSRNKRELFECKSFPIKSRTSRKKRWFSWIIHKFADKNTHFWASFEFFFSISLSEDLMASSTARDQFKWITIISIPTIFFSSDGPEATLFLHLLNTIPSHMRRPFHKYLLGSNSLNRGEKKNAAQKLCEFYGLLHKVI